MNTINNNEYLTVPELAALLRIAEHTLRQYVYQKKVPYVKLTGIKGRVLFKRTTIEQWLEANTVPTLEEIRHGTTN
jgi:excisionase family DNA binding protein